ncbi:MAG: lysine-2,3-aminomutase-like protein [Roseiarcus sp.]|jgi:lysine 2,3-aminomutase
MSSPRPARTLKSPDDLIAAGLVAPWRRGELAAVAARYAIALTPAVARLIEKGDPADPIARQYVPDARELIHDPGEDPDPIGDALKSPVRGVVRRYRDRALVKLVSVCAVYCRFCFRREMVGPGAGALSETDFAAALDYIRARPEIWEVVLTGGDPLALSARRLAETTRALAAIPHVKVLRWHTRLPVAAPERVTKAMTEALTRGHDKTVFVALHANHPRELTQPARAACRRLIDGGVAMVSQSVLLRGVNDDADTLEALMRAFVETRVKPYYLHHGDLAPGTAHLRTSIAEGQALMAELRRRLSGLALPTYSLDIPGAHGKVPIGPAYIARRPDGGYDVADPEGIARRYEDRVAKDETRR